MSASTGGAETELELKLALPAQQAERLRRHPALRPISPHRAVIAELDAIYFDTPDLALQARGVAVRLREAAGQWVQTVKGRGDTAGALHRRSEWETPSEGAGLDFSAIDDPGLRRLLNAPGIGDRLQPVFRTRFRRWARLLVLPDGTRIELALDEGTIEAGKHQAAISEVELELKSGRPAALFELALALQHDVALSPEPRSKAERGYRLHSGVAEQPVRTRTPVLDPAGSPAQACAAFLGAGCDQLQRNLAGASEAADSEFLHQARVALRRLRASFGLFRSVLPADVAAPLAEELRWLAGETGPARDWDVFCEQTLPKVAASFPGHAGLEALAAQAQRLRLQAHAHLRLRLESPRCARLQLELGRLATTLDAAPATPEDGRSAQCLREFARRSLRRRARKCLPGREELAAFDNAQRHAWRIALKKLRYAGDFLLPAIAKPSSSRRWLSTLSSLQDILGSMNDAAVTEGLLAQLKGNDGLEAAALVRGWLAGAASVRLQNLEVARSRLETVAVPWKN